MAVEGFDGVGDDMEFMDCVLIELEKVGGCL
jgi:hypothetical protein